MGKLAGTNVIAQNGRFHLYEGWNTDDVVLPVYTMAELGASTLILTNAAGALNKNYALADIMAITDHLNFMGAHPLAGPNDQNLGPRFPDMSRAYAPQLLKAAILTAKAKNISLQQGIYAAVHGPEFETSAETPFPHYGWRRCRWHVQRARSNCRQPLRHECFGFLSYYQRRYRQ